MTLPNRPKISDSDVDKVAQYYFSGNIPKLLIIGVRGYFANSMGKPGQNDFNIWDDAILVYADGDLIRTFNANTDPSKRRAGKAMLDPGVYQFYRGVHKQRIRAFRAYPEGVRWPCTRQNATGKWAKSLCQLINIHDGGLSDTWSEGCQTIPNFRPDYQFNAFRDLVYSLMDKYRLKTVTYLLLDEPTLRSVLAIAPAKIAPTPDVLVGDDAAAPALELLVHETESATAPPTPAEIAPATPDAAIATGPDAPETPAEKQSPPIETVTVDAPPKEDSTKTGVQMTVAGIAVPTFLVAAFQVIADLVSKGFVDARELGAIVLGFVKENSRYVFYLIGLIIVGILLKKLWKQITLWISMYFAAQPDKNNVEVKPQ